MLILKIFLQFLYLLNLLLIFNYFSHYEIISDSQFRLFQKYSGSSGS